MSKGAGGICSSTTNSSFEEGCESGFEEMETSIGDVDFDESGSTGRNFKGSTAAEMALFSEFTRDEGAL